MGRQIGEIRKHLRERELYLRRLRYITDSYRFEVAHKNASDEALIELSKIILDEDADRLDNWIKRQSIDDIGEMSCASLRSIARGYNIRNWCRLSKEELIASIYEARRKADLPSGNR